VNLTVDILPLWLAVITLATFAAMTVWNLAGAPWKLLSINGLHPLYSLTCVGLAGLWALSVGGHPALEFHLLGLSAMVLMFGWRLALVAGAIALVLLCAVGVGDWAALGMNGLIGVVLPVFLARRLHDLIYARLPRHFFVYVLVSAHFSSMLVIGAVILAGAAVTWVLGAHDLARIVDEYLVFAPMVLLPEGFMNGAVMTMLIALKPEWVRSFDDRDYIDGK
jgi:uncharacterized membrane protein